MNYNSARAIMYIKYIYNLVFCLYLLHFLIAFLNAVTCYITIGEGALDFIIQGYTLNINSIGIRLSGPTELLITLKAIYSIISLLIPSILEVIIWYMYYKGL